MDKTKLQRYADIKLSIAALEEEAEVLKPEIVAFMDGEGAEKIDLKDADGETQIGTFTIEKRRTWEFSVSVKTQKDKLKEMEAEEKAKGTAKWTEAPVLKFIAAK